MSRGDRREAIFEDNEDRERFLKTLGEPNHCRGTQRQRASNGGIGGDEENASNQSPNRETAAKGNHDDTGMDWATTPCRVAEYAGGIDLPAKELKV
jgi:hypothetical protein